MRKRHIFVTMTLIVMILPVLCVGSVDAITLSPAPVMFDNKMLFEVRSRILSFSPQERAKLIEERIRKLSGDPLLQTDEIGPVDGETSTDITAGDRVIMSVTDGDAKAVGKKRLELAQEYALVLKKAIVEQRQARSLKTILTGVVYSVLLTLAFVLFVFLTKRLSTKGYARINEWKGSRIPAVKFQNLEIISSDRIADILIRTTKMIHVIILFIVLYFYVVLLLTFFPWTKDLSAKILGYVVTPIHTIGIAFVSYLPNLFFLSVIVLITYYGLKLVRMIFTTIEKEILTFPGFYPDWAEPTYEITRILIIAFAAVVAFPYMPGSESPAFKGVSIFLGVLLSLGSTAAVANVVAGVILVYMRAFKIGDRVKISDTIGDVTEKTLLVTRLRTIKNEDITIPNAMILGSQVVNYSTSFLETGLILHTGVTIGYDAPWRKVHELLIAAAGKTSHILTDPGPFVLQTSLDDFYVSYEINAYTDKPAKMAVIYSELHQNIQDAFNEAGVEIMSPHYSTLRDGNQITIPQDYLPKTYAAPSFRIFQVGRGDDIVDK